jgi:hypothetical protein
MLRITHWEKTQQAGRLADNIEGIGLRGIKVKRPASQLSLGPSFATCVPRMNSPTAHSLPTIETNAQSDGTYKRDTVDKQEVIFYFKQQRQAGRADG